MMPLSPFLSLPPLFFPRRSGAVRIEPAGRCPNARKREKRIRFSVPLKRAYFLPSWEKLKLLKCAYSPSPLCWPSPRSLAGQSCVPRLLILLLHSGFPRPPVLLRSSVRRKVATFRWHSFLLVFLFFFFFLFFPAPFRFSFSLPLSLFSLLWSSSTLYPSSFSLCRSYPLSLFSFHTGH